ncbi:hypothetical protein [Kribbella italica]|uniref:Uncharacterized protein n=1 Tax=Kribbella italica TaxID=1540520 RepID=A0A7W9J4Z5_9ACTN|nr:hypothetical protein [Kribbella italica]MBB5835475.1 hypothetical protein [Kribbella italica]
MTAYEIRVEGHLDDHWSARLGALTRNADGTTTITAADQTQLYGVLTVLRDLNAVLVEVRTPREGDWGLRASTG